MARTGVTPMPALTKTAGVRSPASSTNVPRGAASSKLAPAVTWSCRNELTRPSRLTEIRSRRPSPGADRE